jgi:hypothetical protein
VSAIVGAERNLPRNTIISSPSQNHTYSRMGIPWLYEDSISFDVITEDGHEGFDKSDMIIFMGRENCFEIRWEIWRIAGCCHLGLFIFD